MLIYRSITLNFPTRVINWKTLRAQRYYHDYTYITNWAAKCIFKFHWTNPTISKVNNINLHEISVNIIRGVIFVIKIPILHGLNNYWPLKWSIITKDIMTSSNRYISALLALCVGSTGHRWIPLSKVSDAELWYFLWSAPGIRNQECFIRHNACYISKLAR